MPAITFKEINGTDYQELTDIYNHYIAHSTATYHIAKINQSAFAANFNLEASNTYAYTILADDDLAGFCLLKQYGKKEGYRFASEITIYLKPEYTGQNIGLKAVRYLDGIARANGIKSVVAALCAENTASRRLFEKTGYAQCGYFKKIGFKFGRVLDNVYYQKVF